MGEKIVVEKAGRGDNRTTSCSLAEGAKVKMGWNGMKGRELVRIANASALPKDSNGPDEKMNR